MYKFSAINFPLCTSVAVSHEFYVVFSLSSTSEYFKISLHTSPLIHELRNYLVLFLTVWRFFQLLLCYWFLVWFHVVGEHIYYSNYFKFADVPFITPNIVYLGMCSTDTWTECMFFASWVECSINVD